MEKRSSAIARVVAAIALVCGFLIVVVVVASSLDGGSDDDGQRNRGTKVGRKSENHPAERKAPATYVVEEGDTLTSIASDTGVSVARIEELNPEVDPQVLVFGEKLKLR